MGYYLIPLLLWLVAVTVMDFKYRKVKNIVFLFGFSYVFALNFLDWRKDVWEQLAAGAAVFLILLPLYALRGMGAGDVKLGAVIGMLWGFSFGLLNVILLTFIFSMCHSILYLNVKNKNIYFLSFYKFMNSNNYFFEKIKSFDMTKSIPFAAYLSIASIFWMFYESPP